MCKYNKTKKIIKKILPILFCVCQYSCFDPVECKFVKWCSLTCITFKTDTAMFKSDQMSKEPAFDRKEFE